MTSALQDIEEYLKLRNQVEWGLKAGIRALARLSGSENPHHPKGGCPGSVRIATSRDIITAEQSPYEGRC